MSNSPFKKAEIVLQSLMDKNCESSSYHNTVYSIGSYDLEMEADRLGFSYIVALHSQHPHLGALRISKEEDNPRTMIFKDGSFIFLIDSGGIAIPERTYTEEKERPVKGHSWFWESYLPDVANVIFNQKDGDITIIKNTGIALSTKKERPNHGGTGEAADYLKFAIELWQDSNDPIVDPNQLDHSNWTDYDIEDAKDLVAMLFFGLTQDTRAEISWSLNCLESSVGFMIEYFENIGTDVTIIATLQEVVNKILDPDIFTGWVLKESIDGEPGRESGYYCSYSITNDTVSYSSYSSHKIIECKKKFEKWLDSKQFNSLENELKTKILKKVKDNEK